MFTDTVFIAPVADTPDISSCMFGDTVPIDPVADTLPSLSDISISKPPADTASIAPVPATPVKVNETLRVPKVEPPYTPVPNKAEEATTAITYLLGNTYYGIRCICCWKLYS